MHYRASSAYSKLEFWGKNFSLETDKSRSDNPSHNVLKCLTRRGRIFMTSRKVANK